VEPADQAAEILERPIGHRPGGIGRQRHVALDEAQDLATLLVDPEMARRAVEPDRLEVEEKTAATRRQLVTTRRRLRSVAAAGQTGIRGSSPTGG